MNRSNKIDIMKAIGIILVVIGHCTNIIFLHRFIYLFHLALFFVISGYLYNEKYADNPWNYIGKILKSYIPLYFIYNTIFVLGHNLFIQIGILDNSLPIYGYPETVCSLLNSFLFISNEPFSAAMWFIPVLIVSLIIFNFITNYSSKTKILQRKELLRFSLVFLITIIGIYLNYKNLNIGLHYQTSFAIMPFIYLGHCIKLYGSKILKSNIKLAALLIILIIIIIYKIPGQVELSQNCLWKPHLFYILSPLMIYVIFTISTYINKHNHILTNLLSYIGKNTISIMCLHILFFKLFDFVYINLITHEYDKIGMFTCSYQDIWIIYSIIGITGPLLTNYIAQKIIQKSKFKIKNFINSKSK